MKSLNILILFILLILTEHSAAANSLTRTDFSLNFGPSLEQSGNIDALGDPTINTGFEVNYFFNDLHGIGVAYSNEFEFDGSREFPGIDGASISTFDIHYAYRLPLSDKFQLVLTPGFGFQTLYEETGDYYWGYSYQDDLSHSWVFDYKIMARFFLADAFFIGAGFFQAFSLEDNYRGRDITGNRLSMQIQLGIAY